jgi:hypothetical protein
MQRYFALIALFLLALPIGISITGCTTNVGAYCNGLGYGPKTGQVASVNLQPETTGISLSWGQTSQVATPTAATCKGAAVNVSLYHYGSSNLLLVDISPSGAVCGGTWNRNSPGGIADYTICTPPAGANTEQCTSTSCGVALITAAGAGVTSNPVPVFVHPPITSITLDTSTNGQPTSCTSQNAAGPTLTPAGPNPNVIVDGPNGVLINSAYLGTITYTPVTPSIVTINNTILSGTGTNGTTTANMPGSTVINATLSAVSSAAGYFYTCPPKSIALSINGGTSAEVKPGSPQNIAAVITDTKGATLNGLSLDYTSTQPQDISVSASGQVTALFPGAATITAICQPTSCNPAPINQIGYSGTGTPVVSNTLSVTAPGQSSNLLWMASTQSQFFSSVDLTNGTPGSPVKLPYLPNSMVLDQAGNNLYFGSYRELMVYSATTSGLSKQDASVPGVVLAVSPDSTTVVIDDQVRQVIYLYTSSTGTNTSIGGVATRAQFSPDGKNVYIVGPNALYVHNAQTGWSTYSASTAPPGPPTGSAASCSLNNNSPIVAGSYNPFCGPDLTVTEPSVATFVSGTPTTAYGFCPDTTNQTRPVYYPLAASVPVTTDHVAKTDDGLHILGADATDDELTDIYFTPGSNTLPIGPCPRTGDTSLPINLTPGHYQTALGVTASAIDQVVASPDSTIAFVLYQAASASGLLPAYQPSATGIGTLTSVQLSGGARSPVAGIFSPNETIFFVSSSGDNLIHFVDPVALKDTQTINPKLTDPSGSAVPAQMLAVKARSTT